MKRKAAAIARLLILAPKALWSAVACHRFHQAGACSRRRPGDPLTASALPAPPRPPQQAGAKKSGGKPPHSKRVAAGLAAIAFLMMFFAFAAGAADKRLPALEGGQVILNWKDFQKILDELMKDGATAAPAKPVPPVTYSFRSAAFMLELKDGLVQAKAEYALEILEPDQWVQVPIGRGDSGVHDVLVDGENALLREADGVVYVLLRGAGQRRLEASYARSAPINPGPNSVTIPVATLPGAIVKLIAPKKLTELAVGGAVVLESAEEGETRVMKLAAGSGDSLTLSYSVPAPAPEVPEGEQAVAKPKLYSELHLMLSINEEVASATAVFNYEIRSAPVTGFELELPPGYELVDAQGEGLLDFRPTADGKLAVRLGYEVKDKYRLTLKLEAKREAASGVVAIPAPKTVGVEREAGYVAVETRDALEVAVEKLEGLASVDPTELPPALQAMAAYPIIHSFRFAKHPFAGALKITKHQDVEVLTATIDVVNMVTLITPDGKSVTRAIYEVRNNQKQYLKIDLPGLTAKGEEGPKVWSASLDGQAVKPTIDQDGRLLLPLKKSSGGRVACEVEFIYLGSVAQMKKAGSISATFPKADLPASEMLVTLYLPPGFEYEDFKGDLEEEADFIVPDEGAIRMRKADSATSYSQGSEVYPRIDILSSLRSRERQQKLEQEVSSQAHQFDNRSTFSEEDIDKKVGADAGPPLPLEAVAEKKSSPAGHLPVLFNLPLRGDKHRFVKLLVMDEAPKLEFKYEKLPDKPFNWALVWHLAKRLIVVLVIVVLLLLVVRLVKGLRRKDKAPTPAPPKEETPAPSP